MKAFLSNVLNRILGSRRPTRPANAPQDPHALERPTDAIYVTKPLIFEVPIDACLYPYGLSYGRSGWHPFVVTLKAYREDRSLTYEESPLKQFYDAFQPASILDLLYPDHVANAHRTAPLTAYDTRAFQPFLPWDGDVTAARSEKGLSVSAGHQAFGPVSDEKGRLEFDRLRDTFESIETHGYLPRPTANGEIRGYFLTEGNRWRFIVRAGQHRTAALAALGHERIRVGFYPDATRAIDGATLEQWPLVRRGVFTPELARDLVHRYLTTDGTWVAEQVGLLEAAASATSGRAPS